MLVKCNYCGKKLDKKEAARHNDKNYHPDCVGEVIDRKELIDYICRMFGFQPGLPGPKIHSQIKTFIEKYKYTHKEMFQALYYFYEIKKQKISEKNSDTIGIIPYVIEESKEFFTELGKKQKRLANSLKPLERVNIVVPQSNGQNKKDCNIINIDDIEECD